MASVRNRASQRVAWRVAAGLSVAVTALSSAAVAGASPSPRTPLPASKPTIPSGSRIEGSTASTTQIRVEVALKVPDPAALQAFVNAVSTPGSAQYHQYLAKGQFATRFGPSSAAIDSVRSWLAASGLSVGLTTADGLLVPATGTVGEVDAAFQTTLSNVRLSTGTTSYVALDAPSVPASQAGVVGGVLGLDNYSEQPAPVFPANEGEEARSGRPASPSGAPATPVTTSSGIPEPTACPAAASAINASSGNPSYTETTIAQLYGFPDLYDQGRLGYGQTIALAEEEPYTAHEIQTFEQCYGLTNPVRQVMVDGGGSPFQQGEAALDIEQVAALAPGSSIVAYDGPGLTDTLTAIADDDSAGAVSASLGACEADFDPAQIASQSVALDQLAAQGQTVVVAAGDGGSDNQCFDINGNPELGVNDPASQPDVLAAGGTMLPLPSANPPTTSEQTTWNNCFGQGPACQTTISGGGGAGTGGISSLFAMPSWQQTAGNGTINSFSSGTPCAQPSGSFCREDPDVSAYADQRVGYSVYTDPLFIETQSGLIPIFPGGWMADAGTSAAAPLWAALLTDINQGCTSTVGMVNPSLYQLGAAGTGAFTDITSGNDDFTNTEGGDYPATSGYDLATGWGTPNALPLASGLQAAGGCPSLTGLSTHFAPPAGGSTLVISGSGLAGATSVAIDSVPAAIVSDSADSVKVTVPPSSPRVGNVTVTTPNGTTATTPFTRFTYGQGYWESASDGGVFAFGDAQFYGSMGGHPLNKPVVGMAATPDGQGYWEVASDGGVFSFGDAQFYGSMGGHPLNKPVVGMAATPDGQGYWEVASDGGVFSFGDAQFYGSMGGHPLNKPVVGMAATPDGQGYWEVASDGGVFSFGDAQFYGSMGGHPLNKPVVGMAATPDGQGYWEVASDGGVFSFGDAQFYGSMGGTHLNAPVVGMAATPGGNGYWEFASDGGVFAFGDAQFDGSMGGRHLNAPVVGMVATAG